MSDRRRFLLLGATLVVLVGAYLTGLWVKRPAVAPLLVPAFNASAVDRIQVGQVNLRRGGAQGWEVQIEGGWYPADRGRVDRMLSALSGLRAARTASRSRSDWAQFKLDPAQASVLKVSSSGKTLAELSVGETAGDGGTYLRSNGDLAVYEVFGNLPSYLTSGPDSWSYLKILPPGVDPGSLQTISVSAHGFTVGGERVDQSYLLTSSVVGGKSEWTVQGTPGVTLDQKKVLSLEGELIQMTGDRFAVNAGGDLTGFAHPLAVITVTTQQGQSWSIIVGKRYGTQFYVKRQDLSYTYLVNQWSLHRAIPRLSALEK